MKHDKVEMVHQYLMSLIIETHVELFMIHIKQQNKAEKYGNTISKQHKLIAIIKWQAITNPKGVERLKVKNIHYFGWALVD